ncbi:aminotransferase class I/II-fold pyridoxal phosphate-dependent enzyme [Kineosporia rhizophila]|uniref:aminotransferase class I/II-fold pyridoxal phosphate-dependent enzyme n=1 Tax=Kineosporia rhizophila TaxID=84633 RepID=UPI000ACDB8B2|nr:aminotransferase class I/II-fold pyridoxal phosphate-dependent enzyme [Kineosporia rhizophila]MCE0537824.1 aminotransferase class I/II-fold pyridoxal phosphate-dependent enzyme [Kineosporia rhizophila]
MAGPTDVPTLEIPGDDFAHFVDRALDGIRSVITQLGDEHVNRRPTPSANSPFGLVTHVIGVMNYWCGRLVGQREIVRDREAEFLATGSAEALLAALDTAQAQFHADLKRLVPGAPPAVKPNPDFIGPTRELSQDGVLLHMYEELAQHHGQLEGLRDALLGSSVPAFEPPLTWLRAKQGVKWSRHPELLPAWVADMDFPVAPVIRQSVLDVLDRGDLGYPAWSSRMDPLAEVFAARMQRRFGWQPDPSAVRGITDLLAGLQILLDLTTEPGDGVVIQEPNYPPFRATVATMKRTSVRLPVVLDQGEWKHDFDRLEAELSSQRAKVLLLVNPHNPTGTAFGREELLRIAELAERHDLVVISDEIHADLVHDPHQHIPFASLSPEIAARTVTLTSATKAFNIAGLRAAVAHVGPQRVRELWDEQPPDIHGVTNVLGVAATRAAWEQGDPWLAGVREHLLRQRDLLDAAVKGMPGVSLRVPDATYLAWLDCTEAGLDESASAFFRREAKVFVSPGPDYGGLPSWTRLNFATSTAVLEQVLGQMSEALGKRA